MTPVDITSLRAITDPEEPLDLSDLRKFVRVVAEESEFELTAAGIAAREEFEGATNRALTERTLELSRDDFPASGVIELPRAPLSSVTWVKYTDEDGVETTFDSSNYFVDARKAPGRIILNPDASWPNVTLRASSAVVVRFVAGYGADDCPDLPEEIRVALGALAARKFDRDDSELPCSLQSIIAKYRVGWFA